MQKDEADVQSEVALLDQEWVHPFSVGRDLVSISNGRAATAAASSGPDTLDTGKQ